jgi:hypothetical protein
MANVAIVGRNRTVDRCGECIRDGVPIPPPKPDRPDPKPASVKEKPMKPKKETPLPTEPPSQAARVFTIGPTLAGRIDRLAAGHRVTAQTIVEYAVRAYVDKIEALDRLTGR